MELGILHCPSTMTVSGGVCAWMWDHATHALTLACMHVLRASGRPNNSWQMTLSYNKTWSVFSSWPKPLLSSFPFLEVVELISHRFLSRFEHRSKVAWCFSTFFLLQPRQFFSPVHVSSQQRWSSCCDQRARRVSIFNKKSQAMCIATMGGYENSWTTAQRLAAEHRTEPQSQRLLLWGSRAEAIRQTIDPVCSAASAGVQINTKRSIQRERYRPRSQVWKTKNLLLALERSFRQVCPFWFADHGYGCESMRRRRPTLSISRICKPTHLSLRLSRSTHDDVGAFPPAPTTNSALRNVQRHS